jgi:hypothetical protein
VLVCVCVCVCVCHVLLNLNGRYMLIYSSFYYYLSSTYVLYMISLVSKRFFKLCVPLDI